MSKFSGKCDFCDHIHMCDKTFEDFKGYNFFIGNHDNEIFLKKESDFVKYYPHLVMAAYSEPSGGVVILSGRSFVDMEEDERLSWKLKGVMREYKRCKRNKIDFDVKRVYNKLKFCAEDEILYEIIVRVKENGNKANTAGIHTNIHNYYRKELAEEMLSVLQKEREEN